MAKTPFELRYETLILAREHLLGKYQADEQRLHFIADEWARQTAADNLSFPTLEEIMECAKTLRDFVDGNN